MKDMMRVKLISLTCALPTVLTSSLLDWIIQRRNLLVNDKSFPLVPAVNPNSRYETTPAYGLGFFKIPTDQLKDDLNPHPELGIVVG